MRPIALITGGSAGIGAAFARQLAGRGHDLVLVARSREKLEAAAAQLRTATGAAVEILVADLSTDAGVAAVEKRIGTSPEPDLLVNNAGFGTAGLFFSGDLGAQDRMHRLHILAVLRLTHAALRGMVERGRGAVINVLSIAGFSAAPGNAGYCATKHWMNAFTDGLDQELKSIGSPVRVQALCPGYTLSEFHDRLGYDRSRVPAFLWLRAEDVVAESLRALDRDRVFVVPGRFYKVVGFFARHLPRRISSAIALSRQRRFRRI